MQTITSADGATIAYEKTGSGPAIIVISNVAEDHTGRSFIAAKLSRTKPLSLSVSVWIATWMSISSATVRQLSMAAGVVPQSSCSLSPTAPARICSRSPSGAGLPSL